jgi:DNA modification methylase
MRIAFQTDFGKAYIGDSLELLESLEDESVHLVLTSPPFSLQRKKADGNAERHEYVEWLSQFAGLVHRKLRGDGSFVVDIGGAYEKGAPAAGTLLPEPRPLTLNP